MTFDFDAVLLDIEGTTTPIAFVHETLFPFAAEHVGTYLADHWEEAAVQLDVASLRSLAAADRAEGRTAITIPEGERGPALEATLAFIRQLMAEDRKATGLKSLQGKIWVAGYERGELLGELYDDVVPAMERWKAAGVPIRIYSSGSIAAQKLLFGHTTAGDLRPFLSGYFDTTTGSKKERESYLKIAEAAGLEPARLLFLTDVAAEADAASAAGLQVALMDRPGNHPQPAHDYPVLQDFGSL